MVHHWKTPVHIRALHALDLELAEVEEVGHEVSVWEHHALIAQLVEPGVREGVYGGDAQAWLINKQLGEKVECINVSILAEDLKKKRGSGE